MLSLKAQNLTAVRNTWTFYYSLCFINFLCIKAFQAFRGLDDKNSNKYYEIKETGWIKEIIYFAIYGEKLFGEKDFKNLLEGKDIIKEKLDEISEYLLKELKGLKIEEISFDRLFKYITNEIDFYKVRKKLIAKFVKKSEKHVDFYTLIYRLFADNIIILDELRYVKPEAKIDDNNVVSLLFNLKNSVNLDERKRYEEIVKRFREITCGYKFSVVLKRKGEEKYAKLLITDKDGFQIPVENAGSGLRELIIILTTIHGHKNKIILLDEPALHLHHTVQRTIFDDIKKDDKNQYFIITHSPFFVDEELLDRTFRFDIKDNKTIVTRFNRYEPKVYDSIDDKVYGDIIKRFKKAKTRRILFSKGVILCEGEHERNLIEILGSHGKINIDDIEILHGEGVDSIKPYLEIIKQFNIPFFIFAGLDLINTRARCEMLKVIDKNDDIVKTCKKEIIHIINEIKRDKGYPSYIDELDKDKKELLEKFIKTLRDNFNIFIMCALDLSHIFGYNEKPDTEKLIKSFEESIENNDIAPEIELLIEYINKWMETLR